MRSLLIFGLLLVSACSSMHEESHSLFYDKQPGISTFDTETKQDREENKWWDKFYGTSTKADE